MEGKCRDGVIFIHTYKHTYMHTYIPTYIDASAHGIEGSGEWSVGEFFV